MHREQTGGRLSGTVPLLVAALVVLAAMPVATAAAGTTGAQHATTQQTVDIADIQEPSGDGGDSPLAGQTVTTSGTVTAVNEADGGFFVQDGTGAYSGVYVAGSTEVAVGDTVEVSGLVEEDYDLTEINVSADGGSVTVTGTAPVPDATTLSTAEAGAEAYESVRVRVTDVNVTATPGQYGEWAVSDGSGTLAVDDVVHGDVTVPEATGGQYDAIVGPLFYSFGAFKVQPETTTGYVPPADDGGDDGTNVTGPTLTVLSYNDVQTAASDPAAMGRLVGALNARRGAADNPTIVVGGGDQVSPSSLSPVSNWTVPVDTLNVLDPAAEVVGNHDLDYGFEAVPAFSAASEFPWLVANIETEDGENVPGTEDYTVVERGDVTVGVVGLVDEAVKPKTAVDFEAEGYVVTDFVDAGSEAATELKTEQGADVVVAAAHVGIPEAKTLAKQTEDIDVIVVGDDEVTFEPQTVDGTVIMEAGGNAQFIAEANLTVGEDDVALEDGRLYELASAGLPTNETAKQVVSDARGEYLSTVAGKTTVPLDSTTANYADETAWGNVVTDAFRAQTGAEVAITNAGGIRGDFVIEPGNVTYDDVYTSLPFGNTLVTKEMTGEQLKEFLASQTDSLDAQYGAQAALQVSGVTYEFVDRPGAEEAVRDVHVNGEPLDPEATYTVTVNSYMAGWTFGDRYGWNMSDLPTVSEDLTLYGTAAVEYVEANSPISPDGENRIRRVTRTAGPVDVAASGGTATLSVAIPDAVESVNASTARVENATGAVLTAESATLADGTLSVTVDADALRSLAANSSALDLYVGYADGELDDQRNGFERSVLDADVSLVSRFDTSGDGEIDFAEVLAVVGAYNNDGSVAGYDVTFADVQATIVAFNTDAAV